MSDLKITEHIIMIDSAAHSPNDVLEAAKTWVKLFGSPHITYPGWDVPEEPGEPTKIRWAATIHGQGRVRGYS